MQLSIYSPVQGQISPLWLSLCCRYHLERLFFFLNVCLLEGYLLTATQSKPTKGLCEHPCADVACPHVPWLEPFVAVISHSSPDLVRKIQHTGIIFSVVSELHHFHQGRLRNTLISSLLFHSVKQSQTPPGTYSSRYFYRTHVLAHTLVLRQPHLTLKMTFKQWTELCSILSKVMPWRSHRMDTGELEMLHCHPDCCLQIYAVVFAEWKKPMSEFLQQPLASSAGQAQTHLPCKG